MIFSYYLLQAKRIQLVYNLPCIFTIISVTSLDSFMFVFWGSFQQRGNYISCFYTIYEYFLSLCLEKKILQT